MQYLVTQVAPIDSCRLVLTFAHGETRVFDVSPYTDKGIFTELRDSNYFRKVSLVHGGIEWPNGQDLSTDTLYLRSEPFSLASAG